MKTLRLKKRKMNSYSLPHPEPRKEDGQRKLSHINMDFKKQKYFGSNCQVRENMLLTERVRLKIAIENSHLIHLAKATPTNKVNLSYLVCPATGSDTTVLLQEGSGYFIRGPTSAFALRQHLMQQAVSQRTFNGGSYAEERVRPHIRATR